MSDENDVDGETYKVGYRRPPKHSQFKRGEPSRNPLGRPRKRRKPADLHRAAAFGEVASKEITVRQGTRQRKMPQVRALMQRIFGDALQGHDKATDQIIRMFAIYKDQSLLPPIVTVEDLEKAGSIEECAKLYEQLMKKPTW